MASFSFLAKTAFFLLLSLCGRQVHAECGVGETTVLDGICAAPSSDPSGYQIFCTISEKLQSILLASVETFLGDGERTLTVFAPTNEAFSDVLGQLEVDTGSFDADEFIQKVGGPGKAENLLLSHVLPDEKLAFEIDCDSRLKTLYDKPDYKPTIKCEKAISGNQVANLVGPGNKELSKFMNRIRDPKLSYPIIADPSNPEEYCNGLVYPLTNQLVLPKKFVKKQVLPIKDM